MIEDYDIKRTSMKWLINNILIHRCTLPNIFHFLHYSMNVIGRKGQT